MATIAIIHNHPIHYKHLLFCELAKRGLEFEVLFSARSSGSRIEAPLPQRQEYVYSIGYDGSYEKAGKLSTIRYVWRSLNRIRPRLVIISGYYDVAAWTGWFWAGFHRAYKILWAESNVFDHQRIPWRESLKRIFVRGCDHAHVYGTSNREYLELLGMPTEKISLKRAIANTALFLKAPVVAVEKREFLTLAYCGRFSPEKNLPFLFRALAAVNQDERKPRLVLKLIGYGPMEDSLRQLASNLGIAELVEFAGKATQAELPQLYQAADVLILPSLCEPWGLVVNEGMLSGLAVAVSKQCGCAADLVTPETGWSFSPYDVGELTRLMGKIAAMPRSELQKMGFVARSLASEYSPENCAAIVMHTISNTMKSRGRSGRGTATQQSQS